MSPHPYRHQQAKAFWSRSVSSNFDPSEIASKRQLILGNDRVMSAGSCFASNLIPWLEQSGIEYVRTERLPRFLEGHPENLGYRNFSAAYGNIYTTRHLMQLVQRALGMFSPQEDRWHQDSFVIDPFRPGLRYPARSNSEFDLLTQQHLNSVIAAVRRSTVFVFTLGLTEAWGSKLDGATYPSCPGTIAGEFDPDLHEFRNFSVSDTTNDLNEAIKLIRTINPELRFVLTVSPVPLVATATDEHVLAATTYSKSVLRVAAQAACDDNVNVDYFPAYEIITGPQAPDYFAADRREVTSEGVRVVMGALFGAFESSAGTAAGRSDIQEQEMGVLRAESLSEAISSAECDEVMMDWNPDHH